MRAILFPYNIGSEGARELARALDTIRVRAEGRYRPRRGDVILNWGNGTAPSWTHVRRWHPRAQMLNHPAQVSIAINKLRTFQRLTNLGIQVPEFTQDRAVALRWRDEGAVVVCRSNLTGSEGRGIILVQGREQMPQVPLYTKHVRHRKEYRVHVFNGQAIDTVQKRHRTDFEGDRNSYIRSHRNGWIFAREGVQAPEAVTTTATRSVIGLGLDFGAVDIAYRERERQPYILEVNTAPGIEGTTVERYAHAVRGLLQPHTR